VSEGVNTNESTVDLIACDLCFKNVPEDELEIIEGPEWVVCPGCHERYGS
jgi:hypothetical protein